MHDTFRYSAAGLVALLAGVAHYSTGDKSDTVARAARAQISIIVGIGIFLSLSAVVYLVRGHTYVNEFRELASHMGALANFLDLKSGRDDEFIRKSVDRFKAAGGERFLVSAEDLADTLNSLDEEYGKGNHIPVDLLVDYQFQTTRALKRFGWDQDAVKRTANLTTMFLASRSVQAAYAKWRDKVGGEPPAFKRLLESLDMDGTEWMTDLARLGQVSADDLHLYMFAWGQLRLADLGFKMKNNERWALPENRVFASPRTLGKYLDELEWAGERLLRRVPWPVAMIHGL